MTSTIMPSRIWPLLSIACLLGSSGLRDERARPARAGVGRRGFDSRQVGPAAHRADHEVAGQRVLQDDGRGGEEAPGGALVRVRADRQRHQGRARPEPPGGARGRDDRPARGRDRDRPGRFQGAGLGVQAGPGGRDRGGQHRQQARRPGPRRAAVKIPFVGPDNRAGAKMVGAYLAGKLKPGDQVGMLEGHQDRVQRPAAEARLRGRREGRRAEDRRLAERPLGDRAGQQDRLGDDRRAPRDQGAALLQRQHGPGRSRR